MLSLGVPQERRTRAETGSALRVGGSQLFCRGVILSASSNITRVLYPLAGGGPRDFLGCGGELLIVTDDLVAIWWSGKKKRDWRFFVASRSDPLGQVLGLLWFVGKNPPFKFTYRFVSFALPI